jgi:hypothetical protein
MHDPHVAATLTERCAHSLKSTRASCQKSKTPAGVGRRAQFFDSGICQSHNSRVVVKQQELLNLPRQKRLVAMKSDAFEKERLSISSEVASRP